MEWKGKEGGEAMNSMMMDDDDGVFVGMDGWMSGLGVGERRRDDDMCLCIKFEFLQLMVLEGVDGWWLQWWRGETKSCSLSLVSFWCCLWSLSLRVCFVGAVVAWPLHDPARCVRRGLFSAFPLFPTSFIILSCWVYLHGLARGASRPSLATLGEYGIGVTEEFRVRRSAGLRTVGIDSCQLNPIPFSFVCDMSMHLQFGTRAVRPKPGLAGSGLGPGDRIGARGIIRRTRVTAAVGVQEGGHVTGLGLPKEGNERAVLQYVTYEIGSAQVPGCFQVVSACRCRLVDEWDWPTLAASKF